MTGDEKHHFHFDLAERAKQEMRDRGFEPELDAQAKAQARAIAGSFDTVHSSGSVRDLRHLLWSSIDNSESRDLDQAEAVEKLANGLIRLRIAIADVDSLVPNGSPLDKHARHNCCSVYTGVAVFPMLPEELSTDRTSLLHDRDRTSVVVEMDIDDAGEVKRTDAYGAVICNRAQLVYEEVGDWLDGRAVIPERIDRKVGMADQIRIQASIADRIYERRLRSGALEFDSVEPRPVLDNGRIVDLKVPGRNSARRLIENFMIAANSAIATMTEERSISSIQRVVRAPVRWPRIVDIARGYGYRLPDEPDALALSGFLAAKRRDDPEGFPELSLSIVKLIGPGEYTLVRGEQDRIGHFGLASYSYTHSTAPNRRYADMVVQRTVKAAMNSGAAPYADAELAEIAAQCSDREDCARRVERFMRKAVAAFWMHDAIGQHFDAIVTGAAPKGTYVRLSGRPVEGRVVRGETGLDVGDRVRVRLVRTDPNRGYIDFEVAS